MIEWRVTTNQLAWKLYLDKDQSRWRSGESQMRWELVARIARRVKC